MQKKVIAFDLDETLTETRSVITDEMSALIEELLKKVHVCVISGGAFGQFEKQLLSNLKVHEELLDSLHLMPTCGTQYYLYDRATKSWIRQYAENFKDEDKKNHSDRARRSD